MSMAVMIEGYLKFNIGSRESFRRGINTEASLSRPDGVPNGGGGTLGPEIGTGGLPEIQ